MSSISIGIERTVHESQHMTLGNFILFLKLFKILNFNVNLSKSEITSLFKKNSENPKEISFREFENICEEIAFLMFQENFNDFPF